MEKLFNKIKVMLENSDDHIYWMNFKFELTSDENFNDLIIPERM